MRLSGVICLLPFMENTSPPALPDNRREQEDQGEQHYSPCTGIADIIQEEPLLVDLERQHGALHPWPALGEGEDDLADLAGSDDQQHEDHEDGGGDLRDDHTPQDAGRARTVDPACAYEFLGDG